MYYQFSKLKLVSVPSIREFSSLWLNQIIRDFLPYLTTLRSIRMQSQRNSSEMVSKSYTCIIGGSLKTIFWYLIHLSNAFSLTFAYPLDQLVYAAKVKKTNMFEWTQERTLVITNNALYNIHKK